MRKQRLQARSHERELVSGRGWSLDSNSDKAPLPKNANAVSSQAQRSFFFFCMWLGPEELLTGNWDSDIGHLSSNYCEFLNR